MYNNYNHAYIFSSDTDLIPAIEASSKIPNSKIFVCLNYDKRHLNSEFTKAGAQVLMLYKKMLCEFALNNPVIPTDETLNDLIKKFK